MKIVFVVAMNLEDFNREVSIVISEMEHSVTRDILLIHHDDGDGLSSAAIVKATAERKGYKVNSLCLEKVYPEVIESLHRDKGKIIIYADIGSSHGDLISKYNEGRNLVIILDHHNPQVAEDSKVHDLNPEYYGLRGEEDFSGATCCYLFSKLISKENVDLSYLALVGSCEIPDSFKGLNETVLKEAIEKGIVDRRGQKINIVKLGINVHNLFSKLQILGPVGYYECGPELGIKACLEGISEETKKKIEDLEEWRKRMNSKLLAILYRQRLKETAHIQWFDAGDLYKGMGSKVIGQFCSFLSYQKRLIKPDKYILGITNLQNDVPGWGKLKGELIKASIRVPRELQRLIDQGKYPSAVNLLIKATEGFGVADGHEYAANVTIPSDKKEALIKNTELVINAFITKIVGTKS